MFLPRNRTKGLPPVQIAVDMSASVTDEEIASFIGEICGLFNQVKPEHIELIEFSTTITQVTKIRQPSRLKQHRFMGRGGTDLHELMDYATRHPKHCLIVFTDGYFYVPPKPSVPVIWVIYKNPEFRADYGLIFHTDGIL